VINFVVQAADPLLRRCGNLADACRAAGRWDDAITLHQRTLTDREHALGPTHPDTLSARSNLARAYRAAKRLDEAIPLHLQASRSPNVDTSPFLARNCLSYQVQGRGEVTGAGKGHPGRGAPSVWRARASTPRGHWAAGIRWRSRLVRR
jgi:tetratricopeptide (TPR) repeat protein